MGNALCCLGTCCISSGINSATRVYRTTTGRLPEAIGKRLRFSDTVINMTIARLLYSLIIIVSFILAIFLRNDWFGFWNIIKIREKYYSKFCQTVFPLLGNISCSGDYMVFRVSFVCFIFFTLHTFLASPLFCVPPRIRLMIQYNGYLLKLPLLGLVFIVSLYIPDQFFQVYSWFCMVVSALFIAVQMLLIMDWALEWQESWVNKGSYDSLDEEDAPCFSGMTIWMWLMLAISIVFYVLGLILFVAEIVLFSTTSFSCHLNRFIIIFTFLVGIAASILSVIVGKGILPASIVFFFAMFSILSAMLSEPGGECSRLHSNGEFISGQVWISYITTIGLICVACFSLIRTAVVTGLSAGKIFTLKKMRETFISDDDDDDKDYYNDISDDDISILDKDDDQLNYQTSQMFWTQLIFCFSACFMAMVLTNWDIKGAVPYKESVMEEWGKSDVSWVAVGMKVAGAWFMYFLFAWACIIPKIVTWRRFD